MIESPGVESPTLVWTNDIDTHDAGLNPNAKLPTTTEPGIAVVSAALSVHPAASAAQPTRQKGIDAYVRLPRR